jgi:hypothetical protein
MRLNRAKKQENSQNTGIFHGYGVSEAPSTL